MKYSPYGLLPPIHSGFAGRRDRCPISGVLATCTPFTYSRNAAPSYVIARCVHAPTGNALGPKAFGTDPFTVTPVAGRKSPT